MDWDKLRVFHAVADAGSFTRAGDLLNLSQSAVSRQIGALEEDLRVPLFHRHARGLILTEQGETLYRTAHEVFSKVQMAEAMLAEDKVHPSGPLTITATIGFSIVWLTPRMVEFQKLYPEIEMTLIAEDRELDLSMREADLAIRMRAPTQLDLVQRRLMTVHNHAYASPAYLEEHGTPIDVADLDDHRLIVYSDGPLSRVTMPNWLLRAGENADKPRRPVLKVNNILAMRAALASPRCPITSCATIRARCGMPELEGPSIETYFVYPEATRSGSRYFAISSSKRSSSPLLERGR